MIKRRGFLKSSSLLALAPSVPAFLQQTARAVETQKDERILVVIQMTGGNDGLNTVVPFAEEGYVKNRKSLRLPENRLHKVSEGIGLHPSMRDTADLFEQQRLNIVQGVGYPNPNRSHDVSMAIWQTARFDRELHQSHGWIGRGLDTLPTPRGNAPSSVLVGDDPTPVILRGVRNVSTSFSTIEDLIAARGLQPERGLQTVPEAADAASEDISAFVHRTALDAWSTADLLRDIADRRDRSASYPSSRLAERLRLISELIQADLGTRVYYAMQDGYDTHSVQSGTHARLLRDMSQGLKAFLDDLAAAGLEQRVVVLCFSEFGRQVKENASAGTDHGTAGPVLLAGSGVAAGISGELPNLLDLKNNAPRHTTDFRGVYATVLNKWLNISPRKTLGADFGELPLFS